MTMSRASLDREAQSYGDLGTSNTCLFEIRCSLLTFANLTINTVFMTGHATVFDSISAAI